MEKEVILKVEGLKNTLRSIKAASSSSLQKLSLKPSMTLRLMSIKVKL